MAFLLNNYVPGGEGDDALNAALEWETAFVNFMKNWIKNEMPDYMSISFNSGE